MTCPVERHRSFGCKAAIFNLRLITGRSTEGLRRARDGALFPAGRWSDECPADKARPLAFSFRRGTGYACSRRPAPICVCKTDAG